MARGMNKTVKSSKVIGGRRYLYYTEYPSQRAAEKVCERLRAYGYNARATQENSVQRYYHNLGRKKKKEIVKRWVVWWANSKK